MTSLLTHTVPGRPLRSFESSELLGIIRKSSSFSSQRFPKTSKILSVMEYSGRDPARVSNLSENGREFSEEVVSFDLSPSTALKFQKGDITLWSVDGSTDAIVNAAEEPMLGGGGVDGAIHRAAGPQLVEACREVPEVRLGVRCPTGEARITPAFLLPVSHVIHTVGPVYGKHDQPEVLLANAYRNSLKIAKENNIQYIAFPAISCGFYRYPHEDASKVAISTIKECSDGLKEVHVVLFSDATYSIWLESAYELLK
ncbi:putative Macro domain-containing protein [Dioscorea sansibarensis]